MKLNRLKQAGDTIVEVMIAIAMISGVLGATFAIANKSSKATQANHERYQAQLLLNQQAEWIKIIAASNRDTLTGLSTSDLYCIKSNFTIPVYSDANCIVDERYKITIKPVQMNKSIGINSGQGTLPGQETNTFYIRITWDSLITSAPENIELVYGI